MTTYLVTWKNKSGATVRTQTNDLSAFRTYVSGQGGLLMGYTVMSTSTAPSSSSGGTVTSSPSTSSVSTSPVPSSSSTSSPSPSPSSSNLQQNVNLLMSGGMTSVVDYGTPNVVSDPILQNVNEPPAATTSTVPISALPPSMQQMVTTVSTGETIGERIDQAVSPSPVPAATTTGIVSSTSSKQVLPSFSSDQQIGFVKQIGSGVSIPTIFERQTKYGVFDYQKTGVIPSSIISQIEIPSELSTFAPEAIGLFQRISYEKFLGLDTKTTEREFNKALMSSYMYMSTQPIWSTDSKSGLTFSEIKAIEPALYLKKGVSGTWSAEFDVKRWSGEAWSNLGSQDLGGVKQAGLAFGEAVTGIFDIDFWTNEDKEYYNAMRRYSTFKGVTSGDVLGTWARVQVPAYENVILPLAGGAVIGKAFTAAKLAGGISKASVLTKSAIVGSTGLAGTSIVLTGHKFATEGVKAGDVVKLGWQLAVGAAGYAAGSSSALSSFSSKYPNISWGGEGIPVASQRYMSFRNITISGQGVAKNIVVGERGYVGYSQVFKPGGKLQQYISFPESPSMVGQRFSMKLGVYGGTRVAAIKNVSSEFRTLSGRRSISSKGIVGEKDVLPVGFKAGFDVVSVRGRYRVGDSFKIGETRNVWVDVKATQTVVPRMLIPKSRNVYDMGFMKPVFGFKPSIGIGVISPSLVGKYNVGYVTPSFSYKPNIRFSSISYNRFVSSTTISGVTPSVFNVTVPDVGFKNFVSTITTPVVDFGRGSVSITTPSFEHKFSGVSKTFSVPAIPPFTPKLGGGGNRWSGEDMLSAKYMYRQFKIPDLGKIMRGVKF